MPLARALARLLVVAFVFVAACNRSTPPAASSAPALTSLGYAPVADIGGGNALTLPAQRHLVRIGSTLLLALQQDGAGALGLGMFRSDDDGASFRGARKRGTDRPPATETRAARDPARCRP